MIRARLAAIVVAVLCSAAAAPAGTRIEREREHVRASFPEGWKPLPDAANTIKHGLLGQDPNTSTELTGDAIAYGDARAGVFGALVWIETEKPVTRSHAEAVGFVKGLRGTLDEAGVKLARWDVSEDATRVSVTFVGTGAAGVELTGVAAVVVDKAGVLHGYAAQCLRTDARATRAAGECARFVASFELTWPTAALRKLEKGK